MGQVGLGHKVISFKLKRNINGEVKVRLFLLSQKLIGNIFLYESFL